MYSSLIESVVKAILHRLYTFRIYITVLSFFQMKIQLLFKSLIIINNTTSTTHSRLVVIIADILIFVVCIHLYLPQRAYILLLMRQQQIDPPLKLKKNCHKTTKTDKLGSMIILFKDVFWT